jgi:hypothetical protein
MIGNLTKGRGMRGLISYLLGDRDHNGDLRPEAVVVGGTAVGTDVNSISRQYAAWRRLNPDAVCPVVHESLSPTVADRPLTHADMAEIGRRWAESMGYEIYTVVSHGDHLHIAALRIKSDGNLVSTWGDFGKSEKIVRKIEREFGLDKIQSSHLLEPERAATHRRATTKGQAKYLEIKGELPPAQRIATAIDAILADKPTREEFEERLAECGISVRSNIASTGKLNGYSYECDGIVVTSKAMGRGYTLANMQKRGLDLSGAKKHEQNQHPEAAGAGSRRGNPGNPEANQRIAGSDRVQPRENIPGNQRVTSSGTFPRNAPATRLRPADRGGLVSPRSAAHRPQPSEKSYELVKKERKMETASISPAASDPNLHLANGWRPHRRADGANWWPQSADDLSVAAGLSLADIEWWRYQSPSSSGITEPRLRIGLTDGAEIELRSDGVSCDRATANAEVALVGLALQRGWSSVTLSGSDDVKRRIAREMLDRGVAVVNPELAEYCQQYCQRIQHEQAIAVQPAAPSPTTRPKLGLAGWREKKQPAPAAPVQPAAHQVAEESAAPVAADAEIDYLAMEQSIKSAAAHAAGLDDVDGVLTYRQNIKAHQLAELAWGHDPNMLASYRSILDADERGYPWSAGMSEKLKQLGEVLDNGEVEQAQELFYEANLQTGHDADSFAHRYCREFNEARELKNENRPT